MIKIETWDEGEQIAVKLEMKGNGIDIVEEAFAILTDLPKRLEETDPNLFHALRIKFEKELNLEEEETDGLN